MIEASDRAERELLALLLGSPEALDIAASIVSPDDWADEMGQVVAHYCWRLYSDGVAVEPATVLDAIDRELRDPRYDEYVRRVLSDVVGGTSVEDLAASVAVAARTRRLREICREVMSDDGRRSATAEREWLLSIAAKVDATTDIRQRRETQADAATLVREVIDPRLAGDYDAKAEVVPTGFCALDRRIGGFRRGALYVLGGRPGSGKSAAAMACIVRACRQPDAAVVVLSIEMPRDQIVARLVAQAGEVRQKALVDGDWSDRELDGIMAARAEMGRWAMCIDDSEEVTPVTMRAAVRRGFRRIRTSHPSARPALIVVDHMHIIREPSASDGYREVSLVSGALRRLAREWDCPVLALAQLNRQLEARTGDARVPNASDLRDSGAIEQDAFGILMMHRPDLYATSDSDLTGRAQLYVRKLREGGSLGAVELTFDAARMAFTSEGDASANLSDMMTGRFETRIQGWHDDD